MLARKRVDAMKEDIDRREKELQKEEQDLQAAEDAEVGEGLRAMLHDMRVASQRTVASSWLS